MNFYPKKRIIVTFKSAMWFLYALVLAHVTSFITEYLYDEPTFIEVMLCFVLIQILTSADILFKQTDDFMKLIGNTLSALLTMQQTLDRANDLLNKHSIDSPESKE